MLKHKVHEGLQTIVLDFIPEWVEQNLRSCKDKKTAIRLTKSLKQAANLVVRYPIRYNNNDLFNFFYCPEKYLPINVDDQDKVNIQRHMRPVYDAIADKIIAHYQINTHENNMVMIDGFQNLQTSTSQAQRFFSEAFEKKAKEWWQKKLSREQRAYIEEYFSKLNDDQIDCLKRNIMYWHPERGIQPSDELPQNLISYYYLGKGFARLDRFLLPVCEGYIEVALAFDFPKKAVIAETAVLPSIKGKLSQFWKYLLKNKA